MYNISAMHGGGYAGVSKGCMTEYSHTRSVAIRSHTMSSNATARVISIRNVFLPTSDSWYKLHCERRLSTKNYEWSLSRR